MCKRPSKEITLKGYPMAIDLQLIDKMLVDYKSPEDIIGKDGLLKQSDTTR